MINNYFFYLILSSLYQNFILSLSSYFVRLRLVISLIIHHMNSIVYREPSTSSVFIKIFCYGYYEYRCTIVFIWSIEFSRSDQEEITWAGTMGVPFLTVSCLRMKKYPVAIRVIKSKRTTQLKTVPVKTESAFGAAGGQYVVHCSDHLS